MKKDIFDNEEVRNLVIWNSQNVVQKFQPTPEGPPVRSNLARRTMASDPQGYHTTDERKVEIHLEVNGKKRFFSYQWKDHVFFGRLLSLMVERPNPMGSVYLVNMIFETGMTGSTNENPITPSLVSDLMTEIPRTFSKESLNLGFFQLDKISIERSTKHFSGLSQAEPELLNLTDLKEYPERTPRTKLIRKVDEDMFLSLGDRIEPEPLAPFVIPLLESGSTLGDEKLLSEWDDRRLYYWAVDLDGRFLIGPGNYLNNLGSQNYLHLLVGQKPALIGGFVTRDSDSHFRVYIDSQIYGFGPDTAALDEMMTWLETLTPILEKLFQRNVSAKFQIEEVGFAAVNPRVDAPQ